MKFAFISLIIFACSFLCFSKQRMQINEELYDQVSFVYVGPSKGLNERSFGHSALRLISKEAPGLKDIVVEFIADIPEEENPFIYFSKGIGFWNYSYPITTEIYPYYDFKHIRTIENDRYLDEIVIDIPIKQVHQLIKNINKFSKTSNERYSFFHENCSYYAAYLIEQVTGVKIKYKSIPFLVDNSVQNTTIAGTKKYSPPATTIRSDYVAKLLSTGPLVSAIKDFDQNETFIHQATSVDFKERIIAYIKLIRIMKSYQQSSQVFKKANFLYRLLQDVESLEYQKAVKKLLSNRDNYYFFQSEIIKLGFKLPYNLYKLQSKIALYRNQPNLVLSYKNPQNKTFKIWLDLKGITYDPKDGIVGFNSLNLGRFVKLRNKNFFLPNSLNYFLDINRKTNNLSTLLIVNKFEQKNSHLDTKTILAANNREDFAGGLGSCYAMVMIQKALMDRAIFLPHLPKDYWGESDKIQTLSEVLNGKIAFIPGYHSINEWTESIERKRFLEFIDQYQYQKVQGRLKSTKYVITESFKNQFIRKKLNRKRIKELKKLTDDGISVPMMIVLKNKKKKRAAIHLGHVLLVLGVKEEGDRYVLKAYDPNSNINTLFSIGRDLKVNAPFYNSEIINAIPLVGPYRKNEILSEKFIKTTEIDLNAVEKSKSNLLKTEYFLLGM